MNREKMAGHLTALFTVIIWGTTFISSKVLLQEFSPVEVLFYRFVLGLAALTFIYPKRMTGTSWKQEVLFAIAGLSGITLYYLMENIALTYTMASNVSVIVSTAPVFTVLFCNLLYKDEKRTGIKFFAGFLITMAGIWLISFNGAALQLNPLGDFLSLIGAVTWGIYSAAYKKITEFGYPVVQTTRRIFFYGVLFMIPFLFFMDFHPDLTGFANPVYLLNILYLGFGACALCFLTWNYAVTALGAVKSSFYIYLVPVITVVVSSIILKEEMTALAWAGTILTITGLFVSEGKSSSKAQKNN